MLSISLPFNYMTLVFTDKMDPKMSSAATATAAEFINRGADAGCRDWGWPDGNQWSKPMGSGSDEWSTDEWR